MQLRRHMMVLTVQCVEHLECLQGRAHDGLNDIDVEVLISLALGGHLPVDLVVGLCTWHDMRQELSQGMVGHLCAHANLIQPGGWAMQPRQMCCARDYC